MTSEAVIHVLHQALFGGIAASGFGLLFNFGWRSVPWCAVCGSLALAIRTLVTDTGWSLEAASLIAALVVGYAARLLDARLGNGDALAAAGCIPMVPGYLAAKGILGFYALAALGPANSAATLVEASQNMTRALFIMAAIITGLAITTVRLKAARSTA